jgi:hypothetical protein
VTRQQLQHAGLRGKAHCAGEQQQQGGDGNDRRAGVQAALLPLASGVRRHVVRQHPRFEAVLAEEALQLRNVRGGGGSKAAAAAAAGSAAEESSMAVSVRLVAATRGDASHGGVNQAAAGCAHVAACGITRRRPRRRRR